MKILISTDQYEYQVSGVTSSVVLLRDELRRLGHEVRILALSPTYRSFEKDGDFFISSFHVPVYPDARMSLRRKGPLINKIIAWKPDIVHVQTEFSTRKLATRVIRELGIPFVVTCHTVYEDYIGYFCPSKRIGKYIIRRLSNRYYNPANALVVPSDKLRKTEQGYKVSCPITVIPTGIELDRFSRRISHEEKEQLLAKYGLTPGKTLVSVCRLAAEKNLDEIVSYMPALLRADPEVKLLIVGDGPHRSELEKHVREAGVEKNVVFAGMIDRYEVYKYYQAGDIFVCASTSESQGLTYVEALSSGLPLVCRRDDCLVGVLDNGKNGYQYETETEFVRGVMHILDDRELAHNMQLHSLENAEGFGAETFGRRMEQLYLDVLSGEI